MLENYLPQVRSQYEALPYPPCMVLGSKPPAMAANLAALPRRQQYEIAELLIGSIITHSLYVTRSADCTAPDRKSVV